MAVNGRDYVVVPMVMLQEQVLAGSKGPLFYSRNEIAKAVQALNGMPITVNHPQLNGLHVSARHPQIAATQKIGEVYNTQMKGHRLHAEGWIDLADAKRVDERVYNALVAEQPIECSTGLFTSNVNNAGSHNGRSYDYDAVDHVPDHLAVLPDALGACILPSQLIEGCFLKASKARYAGEAIRVRTLSGRSLAVTANHPVLTAMGFIPAGQLAEGQDLLHYVGEHESLTTNCDKENAPALVENVFESLKVLLGAEKLVASPLDFHGDAAFFQSNVEVVRPQGALRHDRIAKPAKSLAQGSFSGGRCAETQLSGSSHTEQLLNGMDPSDVALVSGGSEPLTFFSGQPRIRRQGGLGSVSSQSTFSQPFVDHRAGGTDGFANNCGALSSQIGVNDRLDEPFGELLLGNPTLANARVFGPGAELDISLYQLLADRVRVRPGRLDDVSDGLTRQVVAHPAVNHSVRNAPTKNRLAATLDDDALGNESLSDRRAAEVELFSKLVERFPSKVATDQIIHIERFHYEGPVYDFETTTGYIVAEKLLVSNCSVADGCGLNVNANPEGCNQHTGPGCGTGSGIYQRILDRIPQGGTKTIAGTQVERGTKSKDNRFADTSDLYRVKGQDDWTSADGLAKKLESAASAKFKESKSGHESDQSLDAKIYRQHTGGGPAMNTGDPQCPT